MDLPNAKITLMYSLRCPVALKSNFINNFIRFGVLEIRHLYITDETVLAIPFAMMLVFPEPEGP